MATPTKKKNDNFLTEAIHDSKKAFRFVFLFSAAANFLMLALPIYTLQVLDRVISSGSMETLVMLSLITLAFFAAFAFFQLIRSLTLVKIGEWFDRKVSARILAGSIAAKAISPNINSAQNLRDLNTLKQFLTGPGLIALFDAPWSLVYLIVIFIINFWIGVITLVGGIILLFLAMLNERAVRKSLNDANEMTVQSMNYVETSSRNAEAIEAMGMLDALLTHWKAANQKVVNRQTLASNRAGLINAIAKGARMGLQIIVVGMGAIFVLKYHMTVGGIIACSILASRVLAPFEAAISAWNNIASTRKAYDRLSRSIEKAPDRHQTISLPKPEGRLSLDKVIYTFPGSAYPTIKGVGFTMDAGQSLGIIGPSAAGKSTLAKLMMGVWKPTSGNVRLDGADVYSWRRDEFGQHVGYLPQDVELFDGTVRDNIARMREGASDEDVIAAAKMTGAHEMILHLPNGYDTAIGVGGANLSGGQRQRIGLARAFYGNPKFILLDEPNSNLDDAGEQALMMAIRNAKSLGITVVVIAHRPTILSVVDTVMVLRDGQIADYGPAEEMMAKYTRTQVAGQAAPAKQVASGPKAVTQNPASQQKPSTGTAQ